MNDASRSQMAVSWAEKSSSALLRDAREKFASKNYESAHTVCMQLIREGDHAPEAVALLGHLAAAHNNHARAVTVFEKAVTLGHSGAEPWLGMARSCLALHRREEAMAALRRAITAGLDTALECDTAGVVLSRVGRHGEAVEYYRMAVAREPGVASYHYNLGAALQFIGAFSEARTAFSACLALDPKDARARMARVSITKQTAENNDLVSLKQAWEHRPDGDADQALQLAHAIAKVFQDLGEAETAMAWLAKGKREKLTALGQAGRRAEADAALFEAAVEIAEAVNLDDPRTADGPIFITGMPRTGTTLIDRILSCHPEIQAAGELSEFSVALKRQAATPGAYVLDADTLRAGVSVDLRAVGEAYLKNVHHALGLEGRFTDKMPLNIFFAPLILAALPSARVICLHRHPADTVLSNYRQLFATAFSYYSYAYDLDQTARYTVGFNRMISAFADRLPASRFRIIRYEELVEALEPQTRDLLDFVGLGFDPACLDFHKNASPVATASASQVREPLYTSSIGRWRRYSDHMQPALKILRDAGLISPDDGQ